MKKRGQVTIFIIVAIVIVAGLILVFYPQIKRGVTGIFAPITPSVAFQECVDEPLDEAVSIISKQGGSINPENAIMYQDDNIEYLCFTNEYYKTCKIQQPLLRQHIEKEILAYIEPKTGQCIENMKQDLIGRGYTVSGEEELSIQIEQNNIVTKISGFSISKADTGERYEQFEVEKKSNLYDLVMLTTSVLSSEAVYGDTDITTYMIYYPNIKLEKYKQQDGSKIFILTNTQTEDKFQFATRSLSWPAGYGF